MGTNTYFWIKYQRYLYVSYKHKKEKYNSVY